jgi:DNA adenine methylase
MDEELITNLENLTINETKEYEKEYENNNELKEYLEKIKSSSKNIKYKRVNISPLRYGGGKSKAIGIILELLPKLKNKKIISIFCGCSSLEIVLSNILNYEVICYDIFDHLINFWNVLKNNKEELFNELSKLIPDKENFTKNRIILLNHWNKIKPKYLKYKTKNKISLTDNEKNMLDNDNIKKATYYYYNMSLSYGPMFLGWNSKLYLNQNKYNRIINKIKNYELNNISFKTLDFEQSIKKHPKDFLYLDPPYYLNKSKNDNSKMFKGLYPNCNFAIHHNNFKHEKLAELLKEHKSGWILTYNDCDYIRNLYKDYLQFFPKWQYTFGQGELRNGKNRKNNSENKKNIKNSHEIIIISLSSSYY